MRITVVGAGHAGSTVAADLSHKGHNVTILKTSNSLHITTNYQEAISDAELIVLYIQTNYHEEVIKKMCKYIQHGQYILIEPGYLSTCYFLKHCDKDITVIEAESSPIDCRIERPGEVRTLFKNALNPVGVYPLKNKENALNILKKLGYPFALTSSVAEAALHNPNLIVHTIGAIFSIPRIEYTNGEYWMYKEVFTPHIWNVVESLDSEKMDVLERLGCMRMSYVEACRLRNSTDLNRDAKEVFFDYANNSSPKGPNIPDSRYITEDVPEGLVMLESLGEILGVKTPCCTGLINIASSALKRDFRDEGRTVDRLGKTYIDIILNDIKKNN